MCRPSVPSVLRCTLSDCSVLHHRFHCVFGGDEKKSGIKRVRSFFFGKKQCARGKICMQKALRRVFVHVSSPRCARSSCAYAGRIGFLPLAVLQVNCLKWMGFKSPRVLDPTIAGSNPAVYPAGISPVDWSLPPLAANRRGLAPDPNRNAAVRLRPGGCGRSPPRQCRPRLA